MFARGGGRGGGSGALANDANLMSGFLIRSDNGTRQDGRISGDIWLKGALQSALLPALFDSQVAGRVKAPAFAVLNCCAPLISFCERSGTSPDA